jgi:3D (Asp-Asp-Asp) domain-containing protein
LKRILAYVVAAAIMVPAVGAQAQSLDPVGDLIGALAAKVQPLLNTFGLVATLYHGGRGMGERDSLGCRVVPMRTAAVDGVRIRRHTLLFIKETVGLKMPDGRAHDGYWYASDVGGGIHEGRIDLFTGHGADSMAPLMHLNLSTLTVAPVGEFQGCPTA